MERPPGCRRRFAFGSQLTCHLTAFSAQVIHGPEATYNKIALWDWQKLLSVFDSDGLRTKSWKASTRGELEEILANPDFAKADKLQLLEVRMGPLDAPRALIEQAKLTAQLNSA